MADKIIVTNRQALQTKYGAAGFAKIKTAVNGLIAADAARSIKTKLVFIDNAATMKRCKGKPVVTPSSPRENKDAIDAVFRKEKPDYLMILGALDVVAHQDLNNPAYAAGDDDDKYAWSDLPYACDAPYSRDVAKFKGPTRVVGRLPDLTGAKGSPAYLLGLLANATKYKSRKVTDYGKYFGLSAQVWQKSTELSLFNMFGESKSLTIAPPSGPGHPAAKLAPLAHFINCHGAQATPEFYGQKGNAYPVSLSTKALKKKIKAGTVAAVECCYGAELYDSVTLAADIPICQEYLRQGGYGYFGSTTIAYGPADGNAQADLIAQYFILDVLDGASLGRAALMARQKFIEQTAELDPVDLKTLAQFILLGDPSLQPAEVMKATKVPKGIDPEATRQQARGERRRKMSEAGAFLEATKPTASRPQKDPRKSVSVREALANIARAAGISAKREFKAFAVKAPPAAKAMATKAAPLASRYHVTISKGGAKPPEGVGDRIAVVAKEVNGRIIGYRIYRQR
jgi:hypothetical protein